MFYTMQVIYNLLCKSSKKSSALNTYTSVKIILNISSLSITTKFQNIHFLKKYTLFFKKTLLKIFI